MPDSAPPRRRPLHPLLAALRLMVRVVMGTVILLDELVRPLYRPLIDRITALRWMQMFEVWVASLSPYLVLGLIAVPLVVVEPLKVLALLGIAHGHVKTGSIAFVVAYLLSFLLVERIYSAGRPKLMALAPVAWLIRTGEAIHASIVTALRLAELKARARALLRWARLRLR